MFGDVVGDDCWDCCGEGQQEEEFYQCIVIVYGQCCCWMEESYVVGNLVVDEEIGQC